MENGLRHEYKYLISRADAELLKLRLPHIMERDPNAGENGQYTIRSLYFDDVDAAAYYEKVDGLDNRAKYRIRFYNYDGSNIKLEKKEKLGNLTRKSLPGARGASLEGRERAGGSHFSRVRYRHSLQSGDRLAHAGGRGPHRGTLPH